VPAKRGDRVAPPGRARGWEARFATSEAVCHTARSNTWEAWIILTERPTAPENPARRHRLRGSLATHEVGGKLLEQWQYEVTAGGRIWYCPDPERRIVWVVVASPSHPKVTE
jgi:hypothetical protein